MNAGHGDLFRSHRPTVTPMCNRPFSSTSTEVDDSVDQVGPRPNRAKWVWLPILLGLLWLVLGSGSAAAQSCSGTLANVNFGSVSAKDGSTVSGSLNISCSGFATPYVRACANIGLPSNSGTWSDRTLPGPSGAVLHWSIYTDATYTKPWTSFSDSNPQPNIVDIPLSSGAGFAVLPYYAKITGNQPAAPGTYTTTFATVDTLITVSGFTSNPPACSTSFTGSGTFPFAVTAKVVSDCQISATTIDFGQVGQITAPVTSNGTITVTCPSTTSYSVSLDAGQGAGANVGARKLTRNGGSETLTYALYTDAARSRPWGDGSAGTSTASGIGTGSAQNLTIYASLMAPASVPPGLYSDTVIATVTY
ncbi:Csu type fimbrial protein [Dyella terrae]|uniref:Csu type fimbrial protein n=1 Tax=Dyella terrae TaxID=522259 RepID=UPI001EFC5E66|nr:spore coat protein U domain-containing protein [Dyella terrae]ULU27129.1 spore coat protein U domain-containing protein [Dyella terrae]